MDDNKVLFFAWLFAGTIVLASWKFVDIIIWCIQHIRIV